MAGRPSFIGSAVVPLRLVFLMWLAFSLEIYLQIDLGYLGIKPRTTEGLIGIFMAPIIHGSLTHLISNTFPFYFWVPFYFTFIGPCGSGFFKKLFRYQHFGLALSPRPSYHIGASGLIYGLSAFLIFYGFLRPRFSCPADFHCYRGFLWRDFLWCVAGG
jgi:hypothetical protein